MTKMTVAEKILAAHAGKDEVRPGDYIMGSHAVLLRLK